MIRDKCHALTRALCVLIWLFHAGCHASATWQDSLQGSPAIPKPTFRLSNHGHVATLIFFGGTTIHAPAPPSCVASLPIVFRIPLNLVVTDRIELQTTIEGIASGCPGEAYAMIAFCDSRGAAGRISKNTGRFAIAINGRFSETITWPVIPDWPNKRCKNLETLPVIVTILLLADPSLAPHPGSITVQKVQIRARKCGHGKDMAVALN